MLLRDKTALITGASRGIGQAVAEVFVKHGASVILTARSASVQELAAKLDSSGKTATAVVGDLREDATVRECIKVCRARHGKLDILVNNAGAMPQAVLGMIRMEDARQLFELNVLALVNLTQLVSRMMTPRGSIINVSSIAWRGIVGSSMYSASKGAVVSFTLASAKELGPRGIRVNAIAPGFIDTELTRDTTPEVRDRTIAGIRLGRAGTAEEVANTALFLASDLSSYVTGQVVGVDGGMPS
jgi:3-oxoacyl-[acyl-carrier protein] reductase